MNESDNRAAWSPKMAFYNTLGTAIGAIAGLAAILIALLALLRT